MKTPYYIIRKNILDSLTLNLEEALNKYWNNFIISYSYKTNSLPWILKYMKEKKYWAEVVSKDEYQLAKDIGFKDSIVYNGPIKSEETFKEALYENNIINIDSKRELEWLILNNNKEKVKAQIGLRVNFDLEKYCPTESQCGNDGGRFGFCYENNELYNAILTLKKNNISISGIHLHCSTKTRSIRVYITICKIAKEIIKKYDLDLKFIDIGGGFFGGVENKPSFENYFKAISENLQDHIDKNRVKLIIEPGIALVGASIDYMTSVIDVKDTTYNRFIVTDGSRTNIDPLMKKNNYKYRLFTNNKLPKLKKQIVCGYTCMEFDRLLNLIDETELNVDDKILYEKVGAYTMTLTPLFIEYFPDVYIEENQEYTLVRKRWNSKKISED